MNGKWQRKSFTFLYKTFLMLVNDNNEEKNLPLLTYEVDKPVHGLIHWRLMVNNSASVCPIQTIHAVPVNGEFSFMKQPCTTQCPLALLFMENGQLKYQTVCGGIEKTVNVSEKPEEKILRLQTILPPQ
jgi:hypothetical protein